MNTSKQPDPAPPDDAPNAASDPRTAAPAPPPANEDELTTARTAVAALEDRVRRQQAEFVNDTRRIQRQADERVKFAVQPVVTDLLGVVDALNGAIKGLKDAEQDRRIAQGLRLVEKELLDALARHGVARIDAMGKPFDPAVHEAILEVDRPGPARTVVEVTRLGFTLHGRVVRAAHVIVSKGRPEAAAADDARGGAAPADEA